MFYHVYIYIFLLYLLDLRFRWFKDINPYIPDKLLFRQSTLNVAINWMNDELFCVWYSHNKKKKVKKKLYIYRIYVYKYINME